MDLVRICVADAARSERSYRDGLGFETVNVYDIYGPQMETLLEIDKVEMVELMQWNDYADDNNADMRPMNRIGMTHLAFEVDDVNDVQARLVEYGGSARDHTRVEIGADNRPEGDDNDQFDGTASVTCADPHGTRIELLKPPGSPKGKVGSRMCWEAV